RAARIPPARHRAPGRRPRLARVGRLARGRLHGRALARGRAGQCAARALDPRPLALQGMACGSAHARRTAPRGASARRRHPAHLRLSRSRSRGGAARPRHLVARSHRNSTAMYVFRPVRRPLTLSLTLLALLACEDEPTAPGVPLAVRGGLAVVPMGTLPSALVVDLAARQVTRAVALPAG